MNSILPIGHAELAERLAGPQPPLVIDVLTEEDYEAGRVPGAKNACVFNVTFLDEVEKLVPDRATSLVVYGCSARDHASATAAEKLMAAGYTQVADYRGGLEDWRAAGRLVEGTAKTSAGAKAPRDGFHPIDVARSRIAWTGRNLLGAHHGTIKLSAGQIEVRQGRLADGAFTLDMHSIENADLEDSALRDLLVRHLKSDDFFEVERFPEAGFQFTRIQPLIGASPGVPNCEITGELTLKGLTREIVFPAILAPTAEGLLAADAHFDIDRTRWNVGYGSGKLYQKLGKHLVNDAINLALKLVTLRVSS